MSDATAGECEASGLRTYAVFRSDLRIFTPKADDPDRRYTIYDPASDLSYYLGASELSIARRFDGTRSAAEISASLRSQRIAISDEKVAEFERRLFQLGLLAVPGVRATRVRDPATGISYGPLKAALSIPLVRFAPERLLDAVFARVPWLCSSVFVYSGLIVIILALVCVVSHFGAFENDVAGVYAHSWHWLLWHYPVVVASIAVHELGHALACRAYRVRITDFGIAVYLLLASGWARPLQRDWSALSQRARIVTIIMGPYASLLFVALGVGVWNWAPHESAAHTLGVVMAVSAAAALVPTLLPIFNGDTYLAITEYFGVPRLRQRAFRYVRSRLLRQPGGEAPARARRTLYWVTVVGTAVGWVMAWTWLAYGVVRLLSTM
ncbi:M50 family metallopeptidase [Trinickia violacea]|uniref:M50 family metallopeptidase n=1 Tax=Trinickia violacea TaxID=2571746 RepID=A0A4P8J417_9BURK|nr:site-2 protease family protein [Trinickia violacea]QCP55103.1 M50 family metallopeptidase [Trinickia violacea]